ncbi:MAG: zinc ribbon domain-containing protein [Leptospira sp.]|nr:zinc ribbon domain-containing protein [Leptospira sp.]
MATYDYLCKTCGKQFEYVQSMKDDPITECLCEKKGIVERLISSSAGIIFKGSGFYVTDYKKDSKSAPSGTTQQTPNTSASSGPSATPTPDAPSTNSSSAKD